MPPISLRGEIWFGFGLDHPVNRGREEIENEAFDVTSSILEQVQMGFNRSALGDPKTTGGTLRTALFLLHTNWDYIEIEQLQKIDTMAAGIGLHTDQGVSIGITGLADIRTNTYSP